MHVVGIDTHKETLAACTIDDLGQVLGERTFPNEPAGFTALAGWLGELGAVDRISHQATAPSLGSSSSTEASPAPSGGRFGTRDPASPSSPDQRGGPPGSSLWGRRRSPKPHQRWSGSSRRP